MAEIADAFCQRAAGDPFDRLLRGCINIEHVDEVRLMKALGEFIHEMLRARVPMGLEDRVNAMEFAQLRGRERSPNLSGMVSVVVDNRDAASFAPNLKPSVD